MPAVLIAEGAEAAAGFKEPRCQGKSCPIDANDSMAKAMLDAHRRAKRTDENTKTDLSQTPSKIAVCADVRFDGLNQQFHQ
jgi:hypothetical protein